MLDSKDTYEERGSMTLIGAMNCGDFLILAADSASDLGPVRLPPEDKIQRRADPPIAWGFTGDVGLGYTLRNWFNSHTVGWTDWENFRSSVVAQVSRLNGQRRVEMAWAHVQPTDNQLINVLFAIAWQGRQRILAIQDNGGSAYQEQQMWCFAGAGEDAARFVLAGIRSERQVEALDPTPELVRSVMETTIKHMPSALGFPLRMVKVSAAGVEDL